jgi:hypothetical protein
MDCDNQAKVIAFDIEHNPIVLQKASLSINPLNICGAKPHCPACFSIPSSQR